MKFTLIITGAPVSSNSPATALRFAKAVIEHGHQIHRVFLQGDGVLCASDLAVSPQDQLNINQAWRDFAKAKQLDMVVCVASALKRGILDEQEARRYRKPSHNLAEGIELSGLGQLMDAIQHSDRVVTFGA